MLRVLAIVDYSSRQPGRIKHHPAVKRSQHGLSSNLRSRSPDVENRPARQVRGGGSGVCKMHLTQRRCAVDQVSQDLGNVVVHGVDTVLPGGAGACRAYEKPILGRVSVSATAKPINRCYAYLPQRLLSLPSAPVQRVDPALYLPLPPDANGAAVQPVKRSAGRCRCYAAG